MIKMEKVKISKIEEIYCDCPYCGALNSDNENQYNGFENNIIICASCKKKFRGEV